jgi:hypothetical protein
MCSGVVCECVCVCVFLGGELNGGEGVVVIVWGLETACMERKAFLM